MAPRGAGRGHLDSQRFHVLLHRLANTLLAGEIRQEPQVLNHFPKPSPPPSPPAALSAQPLQGSTHTQPHAFPTSTEQPEETLLENTSDDLLALFKTTQ